MHFVEVADIMLQDLLRQAGADPTLIEEMRAHARQNTELYQMAQEEIQAAGKKKRSADTAFMVMTPDEREQLKIDYERASGYEFFRLRF